MNVLAKHIESLLLEHNCVIVPGLGGFVASYVAARCVEGENLFLPPHRRVGFNPLLLLNDGLLVQSYMQAYDVNFPEATAMIDEAVNLIRSELQNAGEIEIGSIGCLSLGVDGCYNFTPNEAGVLSPELYGLDAFEALPLAGQPSSTTTSAIAGKSDTDSQPVSPHSRSYTLRINRYLAHYTAAAAIAMLFYFLWATPLAQAPGHSQIASMLPALQPVVQDTMVTPPADPQPAANEQPSAEPTTTPAPVTTNPEAQHPATNSPEGFTLVLASQVSLKNAESFCQKLADEGWKEAKVTQTGKMVRVVYGHYADEAAAYAALNSLRHEAKHFADAWVLKQ